MFLRRSESIRVLQAAQEAVITAVFWSSLARYYYFMTSGSWGLWHDEIHLDHVNEMPIRFPENKRLRNRIVRVVKKLQNLDRDLAGLALGWEMAHGRLPELEKELDAAVFDLYQLNTAERDLVHEFCSIGLNLFYRSRNSEAVREVHRPERSVGTLEDVSGAKVGLAAYLRVFLESWKRELDADGDLVWQVLSPPSRAPLLAVSFGIYDKRVPLPDGEDRGQWRDVLAKLEKVSLVPMGRSRIFVDTFFRHVGDQELLFVKRNEQRFWSRSAAREDVGSTLAFLMNQEDITLSKRL